MNKLNSIPKKARFLHQESNEYRGLRRVSCLKTLANRISRRANHQELKNVMKES